MTNRAAMEAELAAVLADSTFVRSPVLARLLAFLVETTLAGAAQNLKSYTVAVDGLGRSPELDPQVDTYARVQVARLRKALDGFYAGAGVRRSPRLTIDSGSYEVRLADNGRPEAAGSARSRFRLARPRQGLAILGAIVLAAIALGAGLHWRAESRAALQRWRTSNFPSVIVNVTYQAGTPADSEYADLIRQELLMRIDRYQGVRVYFDSSAKATYAINLTLNRSGKDLLVNTFVVDRRNDRVAWSAPDVIRIDPDDASFRQSDYVSRTAFTIAQAAGIIHVAERRRNYAVDTPYGCWLRFTVRTQNNITSDPALAECAADWHEAVPDHSLAAGLHAWTLLDQSITEIGEERRRDLIEQAIAIVESARALSPTSGFLPAVAVRAYALADEDPAMRVAAEQALKLNPGNLEIEGLVGTMLTLRNDPRGEPMLDHAIAHRSSPPAWYFIAKFVAAMMREDTAAAGGALEQLRHLNHSLPVVSIFAAAYEGRMGHADRARASWARAMRMQPILRLDPDMFFDRTTLSSETSARLKQWLKPVLR